MLQTFSSRPDCWENMCSMQLAQVVSSGGASPLARSPASCLGRGAAANDVRKPLDITLAVLKK